MNILNRGIAVLLIAALTLIGCGGGGGGAGDTTGTAPTAPAGVMASVNSTTQISLSWTAVSGASSYNVYGLAAGTPTPPANRLNISAITTTAYSHAGLTASTAYNYIVTAVNATGESVNSSVVTATTSAVVAPPAAPTSVTATTMSSSQINLAWAIVSTATGYNVYRSTTSPVAITAGNKITATPVATLTYNDTTGLAASTAYYYKITAVNPTEGAASAEATATTSAPAAVAPAAPTGATATAISATQINLTWASVPTATGYNVYRSTAASVTITAGNKITATPVATLTYNNSTGLTASTPYFYKVTAVNSAGESASGSNEVTATTSAVGVANVCVVDTTAPLGMGGNYNYKQCYVNRPTGYSCDQVGMGGVASKYHAQYGYPTGSIATYGFSMQVSCPAPATTFDMGGVFVSTFAGGGGCLSGAACGYGSGGLAGSATLPAGIIGYLDSVVGTNALFDDPNGITSDGTNLYVTDTNNHRIRKVVIATGEVSTIAGGGLPIYLAGPPIVYGSPASIDGIGTSAYFLSPQSITTNGVDLFVVEQGGTVRKINLSTKAVTTLPIYGGANITSDATNLYALQAGQNINQISIATGVSTNLATLPATTTFGGMVTVGSKLYITDWLGKIWMLDLTTKSFTLLMNPNQGFASAPGVISTDGTYLYTTVAQNTTIRKTLIATGTFTSVIKSPNSGFLDGFGAAGVGYSSVGGQIALFYSLRGIVAVGGNLYITDGTRSSRIRKISP